MNNDPRSPVASPPPLSTGDLYDVIVVGARPAGAATAMLLARHGIRTLLLDEGAADPDTISTHALMRAGVLQLRRWDLLDGVIAAGTPVVKRTTFRFGADRVVVTLKPSHGVDALYAPRRSVLDPLLVQNAAVAGAHVHCDTTVTGLIERDGRVFGVHATTTDGRAVDIGARLVVGADGINSTVAQHVAAPYSRLGIHVSATTHAYWSGLETDGYEWIFHPNACCGVIPTNDGEACVFASASRERIGAGGIDVIRAIVAEHEPELAARLERATAVRDPHTWPGERGFIRRSHGPGWALVGDAGCFKDPISAHGLTDSLRDAELLARAVISGFAGAPSALDDALGQYQHNRDRLSALLFDVVDRIAGHQWNDSEIAQLLLQLNSATADEVETLAALEMEEVS